MPKYIKEFYDGYYNDNLEYWESTLLLRFNNDKKILTNFDVDNNSNLISNKVLNHGASNKLYTDLEYIKSNANAAIEYCAEIQSKFKCPSIFTAVNVGEKYAEATEDYVSVIITAGVKTNAISSGKESNTSKRKEGTINIIVIIDKKLTSTAEQQLFMNITEAKTGALYDLNIMSSYSDNLATGTGTDSLVIVSNTDSSDELITYAGGHADVTVLVTKLVRETTIKAILNQIS